MCQRSKIPQKDIKKRVSSQIGVTMIELNDNSTHMITHKCQFSIEMVLSLPSSGRDSSGPIPLL